MLPTMAKRQTNGACLGCMMINALNQLLNPIRRRVRLMISRAVLSAISDGHGIQLVQVKLLEGEVRDGVERFQNYGLTSVPHPGAEGIMACVSGNRDHGVVIAMDDRRFRLQGLASGEVALYDDLGQVIHLKRTGILIETSLNFECRAKNIKLHAEESFKFDVNGQGQKWDGLGVEKWQNDDVAKPNHNHTPPEIP